MIVSKVFQILVLGINYQKHESFLKGFANQPEAEAMRIRYRRSFFLLNIALGVGLTTFHFFGVPTGTLIDALGRYFYFLSGVLGGFVLACDQDFVRFLMKRRARIEVHNHPIFAEKLLWFFLPPETADEAIEHLNIKFQNRKAQYGISYARQWYAWQVLRSFSPAMDQFIERAIKWGILEWIRRQVFKT